MTDELRKYYEDLNTSRSAKHRDDTVEVDAPSRGDHEDLRLRGACRTCRDL